MNGQTKGAVGLTFAMYRGDNLVRRERTEGGIVKIGKDPRSQILLDDELASRMHAVIEATSPADITLIDLGNDTGTLVNGERITKRRIGVGDEMTFGALRLVLESADETQAPAVAANPFTSAAYAVAPIARANPFAMPTAFAAPAAAALPVGRGLGLMNPSGESYAMVKSGPDVSSEEVETQLSSIEVLVSWGSNVLGVSHLTPPRAYWVGEDNGAAPCDWNMPASELGAQRAPIVVPRGDGAALVIPAGARGVVELPGEAPVDVADVIAAGRTRAGEYGQEMALPAGARARIELGRTGIVFQVSAVSAGKAVPAGLASSFEPRTLAFSGASFLGHMAVVAIFAFFMPSLGAGDAEAIDRDHLSTMRTLLNASAIREDAKRETDNPAKDADAREKGGSGDRAAGTEGAAGSNIAKPADHRYAVAGPKENKDPVLARKAALTEASTFGFIGILAAAEATDPKSPSASWGSDEPLGNDPKSALGNMFGNEIGDAFGGGALGLTGPGEGGGGKGRGIGLDNGFGGLGHGGGGGLDQGIGRGRGPIGRGHPIGSPKMREAGNPQVNGRLPPEVIQRTVRQNFGRFRVCYETGLRTNPNLTGRVAVKFAIDREGLVTFTSDGGSDLPDQSVVQCVVRGFGGLSFAKPEGGIVTVVYPIVFSPQ